MVMFPVAVILAASLTTCVASPDIIVRDERSSQCIGEGRFADPHDCGQFYDCVPSNNGGFKAIHQTCYGHAFHPDRKVCVPLQEVKDCAPYLHSSRTSIDANTTHEQLCKTDENEFICSDCKTLVTCIDKKPHTINCGADHYCSMKSSFGGSVCYPGDPKPCTCDGTNTFQPDLYDPSKYLLCSKKNAEPVMLRCPGEFIYNEKLKSCGPVPTAERCTEEGGSCITWGQNCSHAVTFLINSAEDQCACCMEATCDPVCLNNGTCVGTNQCLCPTGWQGQQCQHAICEQGCLHGKCEAPGSCSCSLGWTSDQCQQPICEQGCINGICESPNSCKCAPHWTGDKCDKHECVEQGGVIIGNQCLFLSEETVKWGDANQRCANKPLARLAVFADVNQAKEVVAYLVANASSNAYYVGGSDLATEGTWLWSDGRTIDMATPPWYSGQPNDGASKNCLKVYRDGYYDGACTSKYRYICELGVPTVPKILSRKEQEPAINTKKNNANCISPWVSEGNGGSSCLLFVQRSLDWDGARQHCISAGGDLPLIDMESKRSDILNHYQGSGFVSFWVAANDRSGSWRWVNGNPVSIGGKYGVLRGDATNSMCLYTYASEEQELLVNYCSHTLPNFICEK